MPKARHRHEERCERRRGASKSAVSCCPPQHDPDGLVGVVVVVVVVGGGVGVGVAVATQPGGWVVYLLSREPVSFRRGRLVNAFPVLPRGARE